MSELNVDVVVIWLEICTSLSCSWHQYHLRHFLLQ